MKLEKDSMPKIEFTLTSIEQLDGGRIAEAFKQALQRIASDLHDRPGCADARKVTLDCTFKPQIDVETGDLDSVKTQFQVKDSLPQRKSKVYDFGANRAGHLYFQELDDDNHRQETISMD